MKKYDCIFLDRDGTLNPDPGYISSLNDFIFYDFTLPALQQLAKTGNRFCIITNQSGISRGLIQQDSLQEIHDFITLEFEKNNIPLLGNLCLFRSPRTGNRTKKTWTGDVS